MIKRIQDNDQIAFQYCDYSGNIDSASNPNGSLENIAGVLNKQKNVLGMMPHPERLQKKYLGVMMENQFLKVLLINEQFNLAI